jgi:hypothetical protein
MVRFACFKDLFFFSLAHALSSLGLCAQLVQPVLAHEHAVGLGPLRGLLLGWRRCSGKGC